MKRNELDRISKRATPTEWAQYLIASTVIKLFNTLDTDIGSALRNSVYFKDRLPERGKFIDKSQLKIGRQALPYRIGPTLAKLSFDLIRNNHTDAT